MGQPNPEPNLTSSGLTRNPELGLFSNNKKKKKKKIEALHGLELGFTKCKGPQATS
jgi:hypothetical protein